MSVRKMIPPLLTVGALVGVAYAGYRTHETWLPVVFPPKATKPADAHDHSEGGHEGPRPRPG